MRQPPLNPLLLRLFRLGLLLYPASLRVRYEDQILLTLNDDWRDRRSTSFRFWLRSFVDLLQSSLKERLIMISDRSFSRPILSHALVLGLIFSVLGSVATLVVQQMLRRGANQPQEQMAAFYASQIASGVSPADAVPRNNIDLQHSLEPFVIIYDDHAHPLASTGYLNQAIPSPPRGVFQYAREHGSNIVTWQPQADVRIASVIRRISGPHPGFVLTGRSLLLVEQQENTLYRMSFGVWICVIVLLVFGAFFLGRAQRQQLVLHP